MRRISNVNFEHEGAGRSIRQRDVDSLLETSSDSRIKAPGDIGGAQNEDSIIIIIDTLHLDEEFRFNTSRCIGLILRTR